MAINWSLLTSGDPGGAFQAGFQRGQTTRRDADARGALTALANNPADTHALGVLRAAAPEKAFTIEDRLREQQQRGILSRVFSPEAPAQPAAFAPAPGALGTFANGGPQTGGADAVPAPSALPDGPSPTIAPPATGSFAAPTMLVDPSRLPPRTDGMRINQAALRELYASDPKTAFEVQKMVFDADAATFKRMQHSGGVMAQAAYQLSTIRNPDGTPDMAGRTRELQAMAPQLVALGLQPEMLNQADLSDQGVNRYMSLGRSITDLTRDARLDRRLDADIADDDADNERADLNTADIIEDRRGRRALVARGQDLSDARGRYGIGVASADRRRGQDIGSVDRQRGQDLVDARARAGVGGRGRARVVPGGGPPVAPGTAASPAIVTSPEQARLLPKGTYFKTPDGAVKVR